MFHKLLCLIFVIALISFNFSCVQDTDDELKEVSYTLVIRDSITDAPIEGVEVNVTFSDLSIYNYKSDKNGYVRLELTKSRSNQFLLSHPDYQDIDQMDYVIESQDTTADYILQVVNFKMLPIDYNENLSGSRLRYTFNVVDDSTNSVISNVVVKILTEDGDAITSITNNSGVAVIDSIYSINNLISFEKSGYLAKDTVDNYTIFTDGSNVIFRVFNINLEKE